MSLRVVVLISGEGTNLQAILDDAKSSSLYQVVRVVSNRAEANGLNRAAQAGVPTAVLSPKNFPSREAYDRELAKVIREAKGELIALAGFMRLLSPEFVREFQGRILNIHPALLPSFPGTEAIEQAWNHGVKVTGVTVHFVDEGVDTGPILLQKEVPVGEGETLEQLTQRIHEVEHQLYPRAIRLVAQGMVSREGRRVTIRSPR